MFVRDESRIPKEAYGECTLLCGHKVVAGELLILANDETVGVIEMVVIEEKYPLGSVFWVYNGYVGYLGLLLPIKEIKPHLLTKQKKRDERLN